MALLATRTDFTLEAQRLVRDPALFKWYAVALLAFVFYVYASEVERGRWDVVAAYVWFFLFAAWVYDAPDQRTRWRRVGGLAALDVAMAIVFGVGLGWL